jgi:hypothetical protein
MASRIDSNEIVNNVHNSSSLRLITIHRNILVQQIYHASMINRTKYKDPTTDMLPITKSYCIHPVKVFK